MYRFCHHHIQAPEDAITPRTLGRTMLFLLTTDIPLAYSYCQQEARNSAEEWKMEKGPASFDPFILGLKVTCLVQSKTKWPVARSVETELPRFVSEFPALALWGPSRTSRGKEQSPSSSAPLRLRRVTYTSPGVHTCARANKSTCVMSIAQA